MPGPIPSMCCSALDSSRGRTIEISATLLIVRTAPSRSASSSVVAKRCIASKYVSSFTPKPLQDTPSLDLRPVPGYYPRLSMVSDARERKL